MMRFQLHIFITLLLCSAMDITGLETKDKSNRANPLLRYKDVNCDGDGIYKKCGPPGGQPLCRDKTETYNKGKKGCVKGCFCPEGKVWHENRCITRDRCPCNLHGKEFTPGSKVKKECNICTCINEKWNCTERKCDGRCTIYGDPHYQTFDGKKYDFMGQCSYYLVKTGNVSIEAENVVCIGDVFQNIPIGENSRLPSCTRTVTLKTEGQLIKLKQLHNVVVNGEDIKIPYQMDNVIITKVSSIYLKVDLPNGMQIWWDGRTRVYIDVPSNFEEETRGLCGTYNSNQKDDFLTPEDDIETSPVLFGNKWKTSEKCSDLPTIPQPHPCNSDIENKERAEQHCQIIKSNLFSPCHLIVDPEPYYEDCLFDTCSCGDKFSKCSCPIIATYADECSRRGVILNWRHKHKECGLNCPIGQKYRVCGNSCESTCFDISVKPLCRPQCVEGCNCPEGEALNERNECVPIWECKCYYDGRQFNPGYKEIRPGRKGQLLCTCINAQWRCHLATEKEIIENSKSPCNSSLNMEFTECEQAEPITCKNMHNPDYFTTTICHAGCKCKEGYVLDTTTQKCVKPSECPCHHGGKSYKENAIVQNDCNTCLCQNGRWKCTDHVCPAECSTWGDSHFKTFDDKYYDFQGQCDYVLTQGSSGSDSLDVSIHKESCGSLGTSCSKSLTIRIGSGDSQDSITLIKDKPLPNFKTMKHTIIKRKGLYVIVEAPDLGIVIRWDKGTRIYVKIDARWKGKMKGLCGNYNDNEADDFQTPSGGIAEASAHIFGDSWKLQPYCPETVEIISTCEAKPERKIWATKKCDVLKSPLFAPCHSKVPVNYYVEKCIFDSCACEEGDDCECLCTALAAYAQECNNRGVAIKWRSQELCPIQCDESSPNYYPCISTCPTETCDNLLFNNKLNEVCKKDTCIEGCSPKPCPPDHVYLNSSFLECIPRNKCKCLEINGTIYYEGDLVHSDECQNCFCTRQEIKCVGTPCTTPEPVPIIPTPLTPTCPPGEKKENCAIRCDHLCNYYSSILEENGICTNNKYCEPGCVKTGQNSTCPEEMYLADEDKCVTPRDCLCRSHDGKPIKPGTVYRESSCKTCQCLDNEYFCHNVCMNTSSSTVPTIPKPNITEPKPPPVITITPPPKCDKNHFKYLIQGDQPLPDEAFSASSTLGPEFEAKFARFGNGNPNSWSPKHSGTDQYLDINLGRQEPIYGVIIEGSPTSDKYVTSYKIFYSSNGEDDFLPVLNKTNLPQIFGRPFPGRVPIRQLFKVPFEAQIVRIKPHTWHNDIAIQVELIGCDKFETTPEPPVTERPECEDPMGLDDSTMSDQQVSVSSSLDEEHNKKKLKLSSDNAWQPLVNSRKEFIGFDFWGSRIITGVEIKGGPNGWVTAFKIKYSHDNANWNSIIDQETQNEITFSGNFDSDTNQIYYFNVPINATYVKIIPIKWNKNIQIRVEMLGCFQPYITVPTPPPPKCNKCPEIKIEPTHSCNCEKNKFWDGKNCVNRYECPCVVGNIIYSIGHHYAKEDCSECICKLGGVSECSPKKCDRCKEGLRSVVTSTCECICQPCPGGTTLCPTSNICIDSTLWCNGVQDCPDDEVNCKINSTSPKPTPPIPPTVPPLCPPGYNPVEKPAIRHYLSTFLNFDRKCLKNSDPVEVEVFRRDVKGYKKKTFQRPIIESISGIIIIEGYICVPYEVNFPCPEMVCSNGLIPVAEECHNHDKCPSYICKPPDAECHVTGRIFNTFDKTEYKFDICDHILARDLENDQWQIALRKNSIESSSRNLLIYHDDNLLVLQPDLKVEYNGFQYKIEQTNHIGTLYGHFSISRNGDTIVFTSNRFGFWIIWNKHSNVKLGVLQKLLGTVDGLCGYFNKNQNDDKRKPDGTPARTTVEFGDSWSQNNESELCKVKSCPPHIRNEAWKICNKVENQVFKPCAGVLNTEAFISRCIETACECLQTSDDSRIAKEKCRCDTLQSFVVNCLTAEPNIDLSNWRTSLDCPVTCRAPFVHYDCYRRRCESSCKSPICPNIPRVCFSGCYCPSGLVRDGDDCIEPPKCRDCKCEVSPHLQYVTYDGSNFTVNTNCVYVMSRDKILDGNNAHKFQVLITNVPCESNKKKTCVGEVTILYQNRDIHIANDFSNNKLKFIANGKKIDDFANVADWVQVQETSQKHLEILLPEVEFEVFVNFPSLRVSVETSSHKYKGKLEGLCGNCNNHKFDDFTTASGDIIKDPDEFISSWLYDKIPWGQPKEVCQPIKDTPCPPLPEHSDPCKQILDKKIFGQCHPILNPSFFLEWCRKDTCDNHPERACTSIEAYARDCANAGFCIQWRTNTCPAKTCPNDKVYNPCGTKCPETCDTIKEKAKSCSNVPVEGCFCPEGKVLRNDTCVSVRDCDVCDNEGHHPGDQWKKDKCTICKCSINSAGKYEAICSEIKCINPETLQEYLHYKLEYEHVRGECCPNIKRIACKDGQKIYNVGETWTKPNEFCTVYECLNTTTGSEKIIKFTNCATKCSLGFKYVPPNPKSKQCCGSCKPFACVNDGKVYQIGHKWESPDHCTKYECLGFGESVKVQSAVTICPRLSKYDVDNFVTENITVKGECCKKYKKTACKVNGEIHNVGETWFSPNGDKCKRFMCVKEQGDIIVQETVESCTINCPLGWEYEKKSPDTCCGKCVQKACVLNGEIIKVGETWNSSIDNCVKYSCELMGDEVTVVNHQQYCPPLGNCSKEDIYTEGCCKYCKIVPPSHKLCNIEEMELNKTIGIFTKYFKGFVKCTNKKPIPSLTKCVGTCDSATFFDKHTSSYKNECTCCRPIAFQHVEALIECENGRKWKQKIETPLKCSCNECNSVEEVAPN